MMDLVIANLCSRIHLVVQVFWAWINLHPLSHFVEIRLTFELHWDISFYALFWHQHRLSFASIVGTVWEWSLMNIVSSLVLEYDFSILKLLVEDPCECYRLLKGMSSLAMVRAVFWIFLVLLVWGFHEWQLDDRVFHPVLLQCCSLFHTAWKEWQGRIWFLSCLNYDL